MSVKTLFHDFNLCFDDFADTFPDLTHLQSNKIGMISGGESRILEIYTILKSDSLFAMLDEPFSQIMPLHVATIKELILETKNRKGILITDHMYRNVIDISDSLYVINNQTVYSVKSPDDLIKHGYIAHTII